MVNRPSRRAGPNSALTGYLRSNNISARDITRRSQARLNYLAATAQNGAQNATATSTSNQVEAEENEEGQEVEEEDKKDEDETPAETRKRKRKEAYEIHKMKMTKQFKRKAQRHPSEDEDDIARELIREQESRKQAVANFLAGQTENCEICQQRFTVTTYSRTGPNGGLLCTKCGKKQADEEDAKKSKKTNKGPASKARREPRKKQVGGTFRTGTKSLVTLCIETLAANIGLADSFGDLPPLVVDRIARMLSKRRMMNARTLELFLQYQPEDVCVYDASQLEQPDYIRIFQVCPGVKHLKLYNAIQFRDGAVEFIAGRQFNLESLYLAGANLLTEQGWLGYLKAKGEHLKSLRVYFTDKQFNSAVLQAIRSYCRSLERLKICHNQQISDEELVDIAGMSNLRHIGLHLVKDTTTPTYVSIIENLGKNLETFSIRMVPDVGDELLEAIHDNCTQLSKLRITHSEEMTDAGFVKLFTGWENRPLRFIDFEKCLPMTDADPKVNPDKVGLHSDGFQAMMNHSGRKLKKLNLHGCRHISGEAFEEVFSSDKRYSELLDLEVSFCEPVTDYIVGLIFRSCPNLRTLNVFGCMKLKDVRVPRGKVLIGLPNARGMSIHGTGD
ncbi:RNI-like protein [Annulohypoxylon moriforme]|nr:RNI-like protein [Annulohypoxylon moriforme]